MSRNRRGSPAEPPTQASDEPLAPGPFEELFLKPTRPLDLEGGIDQARDVFPQPPAAAGTTVEGERESVIYSPFTPATASPPAFPQPAGPPPITMEAGVFEPAPPSFEKLVEELVPPPAEEESPQIARRLRIPLPVVVAATLLILIIVAAFLLRERLTPLFFRPPSSAVVAAESQDRSAPPSAAGHPGEAPGAGPLSTFPERQSESPAPESLVEQPAPSQPDVAPAPPEGVPAPAAALPPAGSLIGISWQAIETGTEIVLTGDGSLTPGRVRVNALEAPPRVLVRLAEVRPGAAGEQRAVGTREVERIRIGYHAELSPPELYVVLDLTSPTVALASHTVDHDSVRVTLRRPR